MSSKRPTFKKLKTKVLKKPAVREAYEALGPSIRAQIDQGIAQADAGELTDGEEAVARVRARVATKKEAR